MNDNQLTEEQIAEKQAIASTATEEEKATATSPEFFVDYKSTTMTEKQLRKTPANPDEGLLVVVYFEHTKMFRTQSLKRRKLIDKLVIFTNSRGHKGIAKCVAFDIRSGKPVLVTKDDIPPHPENPDLVFIFENENETRDKA